ncbi:MAG: hypothetical protein GXW85_05180 [Clostridia bacterium]|nr:hypothetical protein [Clostridia bacterium]
MLSLNLNNLKKIKEELKKNSTLGLSMRLRLFLFLVILVITMVLGVVVILILTGTLSTGLTHTENQLQAELAHKLHEVSQQFGQISVQAVKLSQELSTSIEKRLEEKGYKVQDLKNHPELLEPLLAAEFERALFYLEKSKSSGVFIILNATVNPKLENAENSKAGLFVKNMEPNILSSSAPTIVILRGFPNIGRNNYLSLHTQWKMEFDVSNAPYYRLPMEYAKGNKVPLSRQYYWNPAVLLPGTSEEVMLCSVPLIDSGGEVFGVCGFEVSAMLFKLAYMPHNNNYTRAFLMLAPNLGNALDAAGAMFAGGYRAQSSFQNDRLLHIHKKSRNFYSYQEEMGNTYLGFHLPVNLYPKDSPFASYKWALAVMIPEEDIKATIVSNNLKLLFISSLLIVLGIISSSFLSRKYIKPIYKGIDIIKSREIIEAPKTKVQEIDDLIEFLASQSEALQKKPEEEQSSSVLNEFAKNIKTLSPAERQVFNLYMQQYTAKEIASILCLSINTIKTHTKRIYTKLNVNSREELLLFINMLKEAGKELK